MKRRGMLRAGGVVLLSAGGVVLGLSAGGAVVLSAGAVEVESAGGWVASSVLAQAARVSAPAASRAIERSRILVFIAEFPSVRARGGAPFCSRARSPRGGATTGPWFSVPCG